MKILEAKAELLCVSVFLCLEAGQQPSWRFLKLKLLEVSDGVSGPSGGAAASGRSPPSHSSEPESQTPVPRQRFVGSILVVFQTEDQHIVSITAGGF